jgi:chromosome segregation ATPase
MSAKVHSVERLADFKAALQTFAAKAKDAMSSNAMEIRRSQDWLEGQLDLWKAEIRRAEDAVVLAKNELARKKMMRIGDRPPDTTEQEKTLRKARARLAHAEEKRDNAKAWLRQLPEAVQEYDGQAHPFQDALEHDLAKMIAFLEHKIAALEEYQRIHPSAGGTP